ncbi:MAG TPA: cell division protein FtsZ [Chitinophagales bacterium]|nr:cell division protein FtsZ [Chitinophagales bacterium]
MSIQFELSRDQNAIIKVIGVGGGGNNAVNHMFRQGIVGVDFIVCNTDQQALDLSPVGTKLAMGASFTEGRGAGMDPEVGKRAAEEAADQVREILTRGTKMVFITAGMGKGTGTGGAPVIAKVARELGILTVGLVTTPFAAEGPRRLKQAKEGIDELKNYVDTLLIISNDKLREIHGNLTLMAAFNQADGILTNAAKSIAEIITVAGYVNVDFNDVNTVMRNSGVAIMGTALGEGEHRAVHAVEAALNSPLLNDNDIRGARNILLNITSGTTEVTLDEVTDIQDYIQGVAGNDTNIIWGNCTNEALGEKLSVTIIATGFQMTDNLKVQSKKNSVPLIVERTEEPKAHLPFADQMTLKNTEAPIVEQPKPQHVSPVPPVAQAPAQPVAQAPVEQFQKPEPQVLSFTAEPISVDEPKFWETKTTERDLTLRDLNAPKTPSAETQQTGRDASKDKQNRLRGYNYGNFKTPSSIYDRENVPAYVRKNVALNDAAHSSDRNMSPYYLELPDENNPGNVEIKKNSFLHGHDRVD